MTAAIRRTKSNSDTTEQLAHQTRVLHTTRSETAWNSDGNIDVRCATFDERSDNTMNRGDNTTNRGDNARTAKRNDRRAVGATNTGAR